MNFNFLKCCNMDSFEDIQNEIIQINKININANKEENSDINHEIFVELMKNRKKEMEKYDDCYKFRYSALFISSNVSSFSVYVDDLRRVYENCIVSYCKNDDTFVVKKGNDKKLSKIPIPYSKRFENYILKIEKYSVIILRQNLVYDNIKKEILIFDEFTL